MMKSLFNIPQSLINKDLSAFYLAAAAKFTDFEFISEGILKDKKTGNFWLFSKNEIWWKLLPPIAEKRL